MSENTQNRPMLVFLEGKEVTNTSWECRYCRSDRIRSILICSECFLCHSPWLKKEIQERLPIMIGDCGIFVKASDKVRSVTAAMEITEETIESYLKTYELEKTVRIANIIEYPITRFTSI